MQARIAMMLSLLTIAVLSAGPCLGGPVDQGGSLQIACEMTEGCGGGLVYHTPEEELPLLPTVDTVVEAPLTWNESMIVPVHWKVIDHMIRTVGQLPPPATTVPVQPAVIDLPRLAY